jgi:hypothetical protein
LEAIFNSLSWRILRHNDGLGSLLFCFHVCVSVGTTLQKNQTCICTVHGLCSCLESNNFFRQFYLSLT